MKTFFLRAFGCSMNLADAERITTICRAAGLREARDEKSADAVIFVTCSVRQKGEDRVRGLVAAAARENPRQHLLLTGCMLSHGRENLERAMPALSLVFSIAEGDRLADFLANPGVPPRPTVPGGVVRPTLRADGQAPSREAPRFSADDFALGRAFSTPPTRAEPWRAWVPIGSGCDEFCSYCIVPFARGREWWRGIPEIVAEVRAAVDAGAREVVLLGQNVNAFGRTGGHGSAPPVDENGDIKFVQLLRKIEEIPGDFWLRFASPHPAQMGKDFVQFFKTSKKLAPNLHLPLQSGSSKILEKMNRSHDLPGFRALFAGLREARPEASFTADVIVGFPGETEEDFAETLAALREFRFVQVFAAQFSPRVGTAAARMPDDVSPAEKKRRWEVLNELQNGIVAEMYADLVGQTVPVLFEKIARGRALGRTARLENVSVPAGEVRPGELRAVKITGSTGRSGRGEVVG